MKKIMLTIRAESSAATIANHTPSIPKRTGSTSIAMSWKTRVRIKAIAAETAPLLSAVKKAELKTLNPLIKKDMAYTLNP